MPTTGLLAPVDRQWVIGTLKAVGSTDPDVLHAARAKLLAAVGFTRIAGACLLGSGLLSLVVPTTRFLAAPLVVAGWWLWRRGSRNVAAVEAGYEEFRLGTRDSAPGTRRAGGGAEKTR